MTDTIRMRLTTVVEYDAVLSNYEPNAEGHVTAREISLTDIENAGDIVSGAALYGADAITYTLKAASAEPDVEDIISKARDMLRNGASGETALDWIAEELFVGVHA